MTLSVKLCKPKQVSQLPEFTPQTSSCGDRKGACQEYNNSELMTAAVSMAMIARIIGTILYFLGWRLWIRRGGTSPDDGPRYDSVPATGKPESR